jgi:glycosyltransferase involved in cell wall biosynthesis
VKVLLIAEAANPEWVSVPLVGWSLCKALADVADVHVVTQVRNREALSRAGWKEGVDFTALDSEVVAGPLYQAGEAIRRLTGLGWTLTTALASLPYYYFESLVWRRFGARIRAGEFAVVHRVTPLSPTTPSIIGKRCAAAGVPFVVGPLNGGVPWPKGFGDVQASEGEWLSYVRDSYKLLPGYRDTRRSAAAIIAASEFTWNELAPYHDKCVYLPENAIDPERFRATIARPVELPLRLAFVGRLVPYKGADILLEAVAPLVRQGKVVVDIIGDGPEKARLGDLTTRLGIEKGVTLDGWVEHVHLQGRLAQSDVFAFPSVREFGGGAVLEAMALGLVPVVAAYAGPRELVTDATGFRVPLGSRDELIEGVRKTIGHLTERPELVRPMGERARARTMALFTWPRKAQQILQIYRWVLEGGDKPTFGMPLGATAPLDGATALSAPAS